MGKIGRIPFQLLIITTSFLKARKRVFIRMSDKSDEELQNLFVHDVTV